MSTADRQYSGHLFATRPQDPQCRMSLRRRRFLMKGSLARCPHLLVLAMVWLAITVAPTALTAQTYSDLHDFDCTLEGCIPFIGHLMAQGRDGNLYGVLQTGGASNMGTIFKVTPSGTITTLYNFSGAMAKTLAAASPWVRMATSTVQPRSAGPITLEPFSRSHQLAS